MYVLQSILCQWVAWNIIDVLKPNQSLQYYKRYFIIIQYLRDLRNSLKVVNHLSFMSKIIWVLVFYLHYKIYFFRLSPCLSAYFYIFAQCSLYGIRRNITKFSNIFKNKLCGIYLSVI